MGPRMTYSPKNLRICRNFGAEWRGERGMGLDLWGNAGDLSTRAPSAPVYSGY